MYLVIALPFVSFYLRVNFSNSFRNRATGKPLNIGYIYILKMDQNILNEMKTVENFDTVKDMHLLRLEHKASLDDLTHSLDY
jgi:hypothetical protein